MATPDSVLQEINKEFVSLDQDDKKYVYAHYTKVMEKFITIMKCKDSLFNVIYRELFFAGSYYDGLKICKPEEFDVDIVLELPINYKDMYFSSKKVTPGFIKIQASQIDELIQDSEIYAQMSLWIDKDGFLLQSEFRKWMLKVVDTALDSLKQQRNNAQLKIDGQTYQIMRRLSGPAITLNVTLPDETVFEVDLVPVLEFMNPPHWPPHVRKNPFPEIETWFIVPKMNSKNPKEFRDTFWRLAFHKQERELIKDKGQLKPACRLIKKLRDCHGLHKICSYYIKTVFLWKVDEKNKTDPNYWKTASLSQQFLDALKTLSANLAETKIDNYWNPKNNLLSGSGMSKIEQENASISLNKIIGDIERKMHKTPTVFAEHLLTAEEFDRFTNGRIIKANPNTAINAIHYLPIGSHQDGTVLALQNELFELKLTFQQYIEKNELVMADLGMIVSQLRTENGDLRSYIDKQQNGIGFLFRQVKIISPFW